MKKKIITLVVLVLVGVGAVLFAKSYYYSHIFNYNNVINTTIEKFYVSGDVADLDEIANLLSIYEDDDKKIGDIQNTIYKNVKNWVDYLSNKYVCDINNRNSCVLYYDDLDDLRDKIRKLYVFRDKMMSEPKYTVLVESINKNYEKVKEILDNTSAQRQKSYEEDRLEKCHKITGCDDNCRTSFCSCYYLNEQNTKEYVMCKYERKEEKK